MVEAPSVYSQTMRPEPGSTAATPRPDCSTTSAGRPGVFMTTGEVQLAILGRFSFQRLVPDWTSTPAVNDSLSFSTMAIRTSSAKARELDMPRLLLALG